MQIKTFYNNPKRTICLSFLIAILIGSLCLKFPFASKSNINISIFDCFLTATSAICVTGLTPFDTFSTWSIFGQTIILILTQLGAIGFVTFYSILAISVNRKYNLKNIKLAGNEVSGFDFSNFKLIFKRIIKITIFFEILGWVLLIPVFWSKFEFYGIFIAFFTSVSTYCNAGLDLNGIFSPNCSFIPFQQNYYVISIICLLTIAGGLGFLIINELIDLKKFKKKFKLISLHSKISIFSTIILIFIGSIIFFTLEIENSLSSLSLFDKIITSIFHSISSRSTGFTTIDLNMTNSLTKICLCVLMFIGACPGGTGGGIKTTTIAVIFATTLSMIKNSENVSIYNHKIKPIVIYKAVSVLFVSIILISMSTIIIYKIEKTATIPEIIFNVVSYFSTTGFQSTSINKFNFLSKLIFIFLMFIGRIGLLSFAAIFLKNKNNFKKQFTLPEGSVQIN